MRFLVLVAILIYRARSSSDDCGNGLSKNSRWIRELQTYNRDQSNSGQISGTASRGCSVALCKAFVSIFDNNNTPDPKLIELMIPLGITGMQNEESCQSSIPLMNANAAVHSNVNNYNHGFRGAPFFSRYPSNHHQSNNVLLVNSGGSDHHDHPVRSFFSGVKDGIEYLGKSAAAGVVGAYSAVSGNGYVKRIAGHMRGAGDRIAGNMNKDSIGGALRKGAGYVQNGASTAYTGISSNEYVRGAAGAIGSQAGKFYERAKTADYGGAANTLAGGARKVGEFAYNGARTADYRGAANTVSGAVQTGAGVVGDLFNMVRRGF